MRQTASDAVCLPTTPPGAGAGSLVEQFYARNWEAAGQSILEVGRVGKWGSISSQDL